ncbi:MAG: dihydroorotase, partial [Burkholderiales bacterium]
QLEAFASFNGPDFYRLPRNAAKIALTREAWQVPADYSFGGEALVPLRAGERVGWRVGGLA